MLVLLNLILSNEGSRVEAQLERLFGFSKMGFGACQFWLDVLWIVGKTMGMDP